MPNNGQMGRPWGGPVVGLTPPAHPRPPPPTLALIGCSADYFLSCFSLSKVTGREKEKEIRNSDNICPGLGLWWFGGWRGREGERGREEVKDLLKWFNYEKCVTKSPVCSAGIDRVDIITMPLIHSLDLWVSSEEPKKCELRFLLSSMILQILFYCIQK